MPGTLLITRPDYEVTTHYISSWSKHIIDEAVKKNFDLIDLTKDKATQKRFLGILNKKAEAKILVVINGHGNDAAILGHDDKDIISFEEAKSLSKKIVYARACSSINILGKHAVKEGALAYIGYDIPFTFYAENDKASRPLEDKTAELFLDPSNYVATGLIKGHTAGEANMRSRNKFRNNIRRLIIEGPTSPYFYTISDLYDNMMHQICLGNDSASL